MSCTSTDCLQAAARPGLDQADQGSGASTTRTECSDNCCSISTCDRRHFRTGIDSEDYAAICEG